MLSWHSISAKEAVVALDSGPDGLTSAEAARRLGKYGLNRIESPSQPSAVRIFLGQFKNYMILVLVFAALVSILSGETTNAYVIIAIVFFISLLGFVQEYRAEKAMEALRQMTSQQADVKRDGRMMVLPSEELVPGDIVFLEAGDRVPADGRIIEHARLQAVEASLTGESLPIKKDAQPLKPETGLADMRNMVFMGTIISYGNCIALVTATGLETELGRISGLIQLKEEAPPLKAKLQQLSKNLAVIVLFAAAVVFAVEVSRGSPILGTLIIASALAVAGVPESLPFVVTLTLAYGTQVMAAKNAIIRSLPAVETLGSTTVICTDKTGTLTKGEMTVRQIRTYRKIEVSGSGYLPEGRFLFEGRPIDPKDEDLGRILCIGILSNNAEIEHSHGQWHVVGDPTEGALLVAAGKAGLLEAVRNSHEEIAEYPFDSDRKRMTTVHRSKVGEGMVVSMKGAPEVVLDRCSFIQGSEGVLRLTEDDIAEILAASEEMAEGALRVLAMAWKTSDRSSSLDEEMAEAGLTFAGLVGMMDPPREEAMSAIETCKRAGIRTVMITGDHRLTAKAVGAELGIGHGEVVEGWQIDKMSDEEIENSSIFARVTAEHKVRIVSALKNRGHIVAMTGDGVNDGPALKAADIGVAMGKTGTEVAKEASDMVITDDNFATIVAAVEEGRRIFDNLRKGTSYLLSCNLAELLTIFLGVMLGLPVPLIALQILWINVVAEEFPAVGISLEPAHSNLMQRKPRNPKEAILSRGLLIYTLGISAVIFLGTLALFIASLRRGEDLSYARTTAFASLGFSTLFNAYCSRSLDDSALKISPWGNKKLIAGIALSVLALGAAIYIPFLQPVLGTEPLRAESWGVILSACFLVVLASEILKKTVPGLRR